MSSNKIWEKHLESCTTRFVYPACSYLSNIDIHSNVPCLSHPDVCSTRNRCYITNDVDEQRSNGELGMFHQNISEDMDYKIKKSTASGKQDQIATLEELSDDYIIGLLESIEMDPVCEISHQPTQNLFPLNSGNSSFFTIMNCSVNTDEMLRNSMGEDLMVNSRCKQSAKKKRQRSLYLWEFLAKLLLDSRFTNCIRWISQVEGIFFVVDSYAVAKLWGKWKNRENMTYEKMSRAMRYYYKREILEKVPNKKLIYKFGKTALSEINNVNPCLFMGYNQESLKNYQLTQSSYNWL